MALRGDQGRGWIVWADSFEDFLFFGPLGCCFNDWAEVREVDRINSFFISFLFPLRFGSGKIFRSLNSGCSLGGGGGGAGMTKSGGGCQITDSPSLLASGNCCKLSEGVIGCFFLLF